MSPPISFVQKPPNSAHHQDTTPEDPWAAQATIHFTARPLLFTVPLKKDKVSGMRKIIIIHQSSPL
ncbi:hypothetical protein POX_h09612 [Penicillium oxalicum]|uniref:hypothetical protein n=1 Tax=Penicillium oxalicum TaxID=69781 RepID=UPI0020B700A2|nr:hypothetical protein POX_h09612 [Penicillium oxalicum]KAI2785850.1 hypothetical protein POX_h09612 [Penicillium oxalicum]